MEADTCHSGDTRDTLLWLGQSFWDAFSPGQTLTLRKGAEVLI